PPPPLTPRELPPRSLCSFLEYRSVLFPSAPSRGGDPASDLAGLAASYGLPFLDRVAATYPLAADPDVRNRIAFYRLAFAAMDALYGLDHADDHALRAGIAGVAQLASDDASPASGTSRQT
ncbi:MAG: hypothetical protein ACTHMX_08980, partial [Thermomicrobiales bacterium]